MGPRSGGAHIGSQHFERLKLRPWLETVRAHPSRAHYASLRPAPPSGRRDGTPVHYERSVRSRPRYIRAAAKAGVGAARAWQTEDELNGISYEREDPEIYDLFSRECAKSGAEVRLVRPEYVRS